MCGRGGVWLGVTRGCVMSYLTFQRGRGNRKLANPQRLGIPNWLWICQANPQLA